MATREITVTPWSGDEEPTAGAIHRRLADEGLKPYRWSNHPGDTYGTHAHNYHKVIYVLEGSITFGLPDRGEKVELHKGDRLEVPPGVRHDAVVGPRGVVCLEAHR